MPLRRRGFTLIELLLVVVIIGIVAGISAMRYWRTRDRAYVASMQSELRTLLSAEENFRSDSSRYTADQDQLVMLRHSTGVTLDIDRADDRTWHAVAHHQATAKTCEASGGVGTPGALMGEISCR